MAYAPPTDTYLSANSSQLKHHSLNPLLQGLCFNCLKQAKYTRCISVFSFGAFIRNPLILQLYRGYDIGQFTASQEDQQQISGRVVNTIYEKQIGRPEIFDNQKHSLNILEMQPVTPNYGEMGSSTGFKKRSLIRPPSSAGLKDRDFLRSVDISQSQAMLSTMLKTEVASIQEDINQLDIDKKIRLGEGTFEKGYILAMKKWLREVHGNLERQEDEAKILKYMNVPDVQTGFKKLWRIVSLLDSMVVRSTELQVVSLLKYDDLFYSLCKDYTPLNKKLSAVGQSFSVATFQATQIMVERMQDLFSLVSKVRKANSTGGGHNETDDIIHKLQSENAKLNSYLEKLTDELKANKKQQQQVIAQPIQSTPVLPSASTSVKVEKAALDNAFNEINQKYKDEINNLSRQIEQFLNQEARLKQQLKMAQQKQQMLLGDLKEAGLKSIRQTQSNTYQAALQEEIAHMKAGYDAKIKRLVEDFAIRERDLKRKENEYRVEAEKVKFERSLLLKKYDLMK